MTRVEGMGRAFAELGLAEDKTDPTFSIDPLVISKMIMRESQMDLNGYFGGFTPDIVASVMQMQGEPLDPAYNPLWAQDVPNLGIDASVRRATSNYSMGPHSLVPLQDATIESINSMIDRFRGLHGNMPFQFVYEPYRVIDQLQLPEPLNFMTADMNIEGFLAPPGMSLLSEVSKLYEDYARERDAHLIGQVFDIPLCILGEDCDYKSHKPPTRLEKLRRHLYSLYGKVSWARERFARRVYELISKYDFEEEGEDW